MKVLPTLAVLLITFTAGTAPAAFSPDELKCRKIVSKNMNKVAKAASKAQAGCHKARNVDRRPLTDDCNDLSVADDTLKYDKAKNKFVAAVQKSCVDAGVDPARIMAEYISCSTSCTASQALDNPLAQTTDGMLQLASCLGCMAGEQASLRNVQALGLPPALLDDPVTGKDDQKCHQSLAKGFDKVVLTTLKARTKCQKSAEKKEGAEGLGDTDCLTDDSKGKIAKAATKAEGLVTSACDGVDFAAYALTGGCSGATDPASYNACAGVEAASAGDSLVSATYRLDPQDVCPSRLDTLIGGGFGKTCTNNADCDAPQSCQVAGPVSRCATPSNLDMGWTGWGTTWTLLASIWCRSMSAARPVPRARLHA